MTDSFSVEIRGKEEFEKTLKELAQCLPNDKVEPLLMDGAKIIRDAAKRNVHHSRSGNLIKHIIAKKLRQISNYPRSAAATVQQAPWEAPHAHLIEYGTSERYQKTTGRRTGVGPAQPFWRPAIDANVDRIYEQIKNKLLNMIDEAARK